MDVEFVSPDGKAGTGLLTLARRRCWWQACGCLYGVFPRDNSRDFVKLMDKVNRFVYESSASNCYATFFFAAYDAKTRRLDCVDAFTSGAPQHDDMTMLVLKLEE